MEIKINEQQIDYWKIQLEESLADEKWIAFIKELYPKRQVVKEEIVTFLKRYTSRQISNEEFRKIYDKETKTTWDVFGLKAMSGAMFLNKLVKHIPDENTLRNQLEKVLSLPEDVEDGKLRMRGFLSFLEELIKTGMTTKQLIQPARTPFFVSSWWHLQNPAQWPIYYESARKVLRMKEIYNPSNDIIENYFMFRKGYLELESLLRTKTWELESLCYWIDNQKKDLPENEHPLDNSTADKAKEEYEEDANETISHSHIQWLLAKIGRKLGCRIWIASNDHNKKWNNERLGDFSIEALPSLGLDSQSGKIIKMIDILWLKGSNQVVAAFEIEHTTSIYSGLLRMSDLTALSPNLNFPLYIVTPKERLEKVRRELTRPTFQALELHKRCGFFSSEKIIQEAENIMKYSTDTAVIDKIASNVDDIGIID